MASKPAPKKAPPTKTTEAKKPAARKTAVGVAAPVPPQKKPAPAKKPVKGAAKAAAIYSLSDPDTGEVRYIGKANNPSARLKSHMRDSRRRNTPVYCWIRRLRNDGKEPSMSVIEWSGDWIEAEKRVIATYKSNGARLLNLAEGGDEPNCAIGQRRLNGAHVARTRNKAVWAAQRHLGQLQRYFDQAGSQRYSELVRGIRMLFNSLSQQQQEAFGRRFGGAA